MGGAWASHENSAKKPIDESDAPSTMLRMVPLPRLHGGGQTNPFSRRVFIAPELCRPPQQQSPFDLLPSPRKIMRNKEGSGAPRGASSPMAAPYSLPSPLVGEGWEGGRQRATQTSVRSLRTRLLSGRARLPALHCGSRQGYDPLAQLQAMLPGTRSRRALYASASARVASGGDQPVAPDPVLA